MPIHVDTMQQAVRTIELPPGPALLYVPEGDAPTVTILDRAPSGGLPQDRDRAICRALLEYVLDQMDNGEPPRAREAPIALGWTPPTSTAACPDWSMSREHAAHEWDGAVRVPGRFECPGWPTSEDDR